jgi:hypothetical protein
MPAHRQPRFAAAAVRWSHQARSARLAREHNVIPFLFFLMGISRVCCVMSAPSFSRSSFYCNSHLLLFFILPPNSSLDNTCAEALDLRASILSECAIVCFTNVVRDARAPMGPRRENKASPREYTETGG